MVSMRHFSSGVILYGRGSFNNRVTATLGARLMDSTAGAIILAGNDFPDALMKRIMQWDMMLLVKKLPDSPCTRGFVQYKDEESCRW